MKHHHKKKMLSLYILGAFWLFVYLGVPVKVDAENVPEHEMQKGSITYINPLYSDVVSETDLLQGNAIETIQGCEVNYSNDYQESLTGEGYEFYSDSAFNSIEEVAGFVQVCMEKRQESISFQYTTDQEDYAAILNSVMELAMEHTGIPTQGDYLKFQYAGWKAQCGYYISEGIYQYHFDLTVTYYTSKDQENAVSTTVESILEEMAMEEKTDYEKISLIYSYITANTTYDYTNLNDKEYRLKFTAYAALIDKTAVCQGYAVLLYRMLTESGVDCRIISGIGNGGNHAWNIVRLDEKYYNADSTWDAGETEYDWFLLNDENFVNHSRGDEYKTEEFYTCYPMGETNYDPASQEIINEDYILGDVNNDGKVNRIDRTYLARYLANWDGYELVNEKSADVNRDGKVNRTDRTYIARYLANWAGYTLTAE